MKKIIFKHSSGGLSILIPVEGARLADRITLFDGSIHAPESRIASPIDSILLGWPIAGAVADWAESEDEFVNRIAFKDVPVTLVAPPVGTPPMISRKMALSSGFAFTETPYQVIDAAALPTDRTFRNAWAININDAAVEVDMVKARELQRDRLRFLRKPLMEKLDIEYLKADETTDLLAKQAITARKQALRDVTNDQGINAAKDADELKVAGMAIIIAEQAR